MNRTKLNSRWGSTHELIAKAHRIICCTHLHPDGDGLGSQLALYHFLSSQGKEFRILNPSPLPEEYRFMSKYVQFEQYERRFHLAWIGKADLAIVLDIGDYRRLRELGEDFRELEIPTLSIDHHPHPYPNGFMYSIHDVSASATGYLVYEYIRFAGDRFNIGNGLTPQIAQGLYVAIMTDTGSFRFSNTSPEVHEMAGELIRHGIKPHDVYERVYESAPVARIRLMALALETVQIDGDGQVAWFMVTRKMIGEADAKPQHVSGFTDTVRSIRGVEVAVMIFEVDDNRCRVNFRSKGRVRIDDLARRLGGGGHPFAAAASIKQPLEQAVEYVVSNVVQETNIQLHGGKPE